MNRTFSRTFDHPAHLPACVSRRGRHSLPSPADLTACQCLRAYNTVTHLRLPCTFCMMRTEVLPDLFSFFSTNMPQREHFVCRLSFGKVEHGVNRLSKSASATGRGVPKRPLCACYPSDLQQPNFLGAKMCGKREP